MKKYSKNNKSLNINEQYRIVVASSLICSTMLLSSCNNESITKISDRNVNDTSSTKTDYTQTNESTETHGISVDSTTISSQANNNHDISIIDSESIESDAEMIIDWEPTIDCDKFKTFLLVNYNIDYDLFFNFYGQDEIMEKYLAEYYNKENNTNFERIPLSKVGYLRYLIAKHSGYGSLIDHDEEIDDYFQVMFNIGFTFKTPLYCDPCIYLYDINNNHSLDSIIPLEEIQNYMKEPLFNKEIALQKEGIYANYSGSLCRDSETFGYYLSYVNALNISIDASYKIINLGAEESDEYYTKVEAMNKHYHKYFLEKYGIDYEFHVDQPLDASFIDDVLIPAFGEDKVKEAQENLNRLQEEALAKQSEAPEKESQNVRSR